MYGLAGQLDGSRYGAYGFDNAGRNGPVVNGASGSTALYHHNGSRYGLGLGRGGAPDGKMNGLHGPKHKRGDMDRKSLTRLLANWKSSSLRFFQSTVSPVPALKTCRVKFQRCARINMVVGTFRRS